jgi:hypothetical protein
MEPGNQSSQWIPVEDYAVDVELEPSELIEPSRRGNFRLDTSPVI